MTRAARSDGARRSRIVGAGLAVLAMAVYLVACGYLAQLLARVLAQVITLLPQQFGLVQGVALALR